MEKKKVGDAGFRTQDLLLAKQMLYRWATSPPGEGCNCGSYQCNFPNTVIRTRWSEWSGILTQNDCVGQLCIDTSYNCIPTARRGCSSAVERLLCMQKVLGSKPSISNFFFFHSLCSTIFVYDPTFLVLLPSPFCRCLLMASCLCLAWNRSSWTPL